MIQPKPWTPRPYQLEALEFALSRRASGLMLDPGLGKTSTFLAYISTLMERGEVKRSLVCAPLRVAKTVWPVEAQKWADFNHLKIVDLTEKTDAQREELLSGKGDVFVINPESLYKIINPEQITGVKGSNVPNIWDIDLFLADESTRFADPSTKRFKALKSVLPHYEYRNIASGTPAPTGLWQLFGQCYLLDFGDALGSYVTHFRQMYMSPHPYVPHTYVMNPGAGDRIYAKVADLLLRMKAKDHLEMPELIENRIMVKLSAAARQKYDVLERDFLIQVLNETIPAFNRASLGVKLRQVANGFIYSQERPGVGLHIHTAKLDALAGLIEEMQERPLLVMYEFIEDGRAIQERFPFAVNITGAKDIERVVRDFNAGKIPLLIGHPRSAGHGLNLQESCHDICWFGVTWDLELWLQAIARVWRQGQPSSVVTNHIIVAEDTTDEGVLTGLSMKDANQEAFDQALISYAKRRLG